MVGLQQTSLRLHSLKTLFVHLREKVVLNITELTWRHTEKSHETLNQMRAFKKMTQITQVIFFSFIFVEICRFGRKYICFVVCSILHLQNSIDSVIYQNVFILTIANDWINGLIMMNGKSKNNFQN